MASDTEKQLIGLCTNANLPALKDFITKQRLNPSEVKDSSGFTLLHLACQHGHLDIVQYLIKDQNCSPETTTPNGHTPLHIACKSGHLHVVKYLITDHKCNPHCTDNDGYTPLHATSESGNIETVKYLITEQGCDPQVSDNIGNTPLHYASESGHLDIVQYLITEFNCEPQKSNSRGSIPLHFACKGGQTAVARYLIDERHCDPNSTNKFGCTSLDVACLSSCLLLVKYLIAEHGCNPHIANTDGNTPLHNACLNGHLDITKYLISDCNCNPHCSDKNGITPLHCACYNGHLEVAKYLITEHKCSPEHGDVDGCTPLHSAAINGHLAVMKHLIVHHNCNPQCIDDNGITPLHLACLNGHLHVAKYLILEQKCSHKTKCNKGGTPLHYACLKGHLSVMKYLIVELGCDPHITFSDGHTLLHYACILGHLDVTKFLISDCNYNPECFSSKILTPLAMACLNGSFQVAKYLVTEHKCSPERDIIEGMTVLHFAADKGNLRCVKFLVGELHCNPHTADNKGNTPLHHACQNGHLEVAKYLITEHKCSPEVANAIGFTPLHSAAWNGHLAVVKYLTHVQQCSCEMKCIKGYTPLFHACLRGHLLVMKYLIIELGCNPHVSCSNGKTLLYYACLTGNLDITKFLISECNCNLECLENGRLTPLNLVCMTGHLEIAKYLITKHNCNLKHCDADGCTPLYYAALGGNLALVKYFISDLGCNPQITTNDGLTPLHFACLNGHLDITKYLTSDCNYNPQSPTNRGVVPLRNASLNGHLEIAKYLITEHKCSPEPCDTKGYTPLHFAAIKGHLAVIKYLVTKCHCNPQCSDSNGVSPLHLACSSGHLHVVKYLIEEQKCSGETKCTVEVIHRIRPTSHLNFNYTGLTAIDFARGGGHQEIFNYLRNEHHCSSGFDQAFNSVMPQISFHLYGDNDAMDSTGLNFNDVCFSQLQVACLTGNLAAVKLSATKFNCNSSDGFPGGFTPLSIACMMGHLEIAKYLVAEYGCDPNCAIRNADVVFTPLFIATVNGQLEVVSWLVREQNCELLCLDSQCEYSVPLYITACLFGHLEILKFLLSETATHNLEIPDLLLAACFVGYLDIVKYLIDKYKSNPHIIDEDSISLLHVVCGGFQYFEARERHMSARSINYVLSIQGMLHILLAILNLPVKLLSDVLPNIFLDSDNELFIYDITNYIMNTNNNTRSYEEQATPYNLRCLDIVKYLINEHNCNPQCRDKEGKTPLHYASASGKLEIVQHFHDHKLSDLVHTAHSGDTPLHFACKYNQVNVAQFLLSTGECDPLIENTEGQTPVEIAASPEIRKLLDHFCKGSYPLESVVKVFVLGDPMAGKSSLVQAIQSNPGFLSSLIGRFQKVKGLRQQTAGIDSFSFSSSEFGNVVIYDFAGQREFYTSHAAFLQNSSSYIPGIFILVANIADCEDTISQCLQYWTSFIQECCAHMHTETKASLIIIGSHADQLDIGSVEMVVSKIEKYFSLNFKSGDQLLEIEGVICLDCTRQSSPGLNLLHYHLEESCNSIRKRSEKIDQRCYVLHKYVHKEYINKEIHGTILKSISKDLEDNPYLLPSTATELLPLFQTLHDKGQILLLKNNQEIPNSWIIANIPAILETVVGSIFAPRDFPQHIAPGSTGIVPKSRMSEAFSALNIDMIIGFLEHFEFCHRVGLNWVIQSKHEVSDTNDEYYLFPALVTLKNIPQVLHESHENHYYCGWFMHSTAKHQFFTIRLLHVLLLRLAFLFALPQDNAIPSASEVETPVLKRSCTMWKNGITWRDTNGVSTHFEVRELKTVILVMSSMKGSEIHCVRLRTQLIKTILKARKELCPRVDVEECIMEVGNNRLVETIERCPSQSTKYSLKYLCDRISTRNASDHQDLVLVNPDGSPGKLISDLLYFEPYTLLTSDLITQMFSRHTSSLILSDAFLSELAARFYRCKSILSQILRPHPRLLSETLKMNVYSLDSLDEMSKHLKCLHILEAWMEQQDSPATYRKLRHELDKYSIFCGRNPLDLSGGCGESSDEGSDESSDSERRDDNGKECSSCDDQADRPTLIECIRFRGRERRINIPQEIGIKYHDFGLFLLEDDTGARIQSIAHKHRNDAEQINMEVLEKWITGRGKHPVTWRTLTQVLHDIDLKTLAGEIAILKCHDLPVEEDISTVITQDLKHGGTGVSEGHGVGDITAESSDIRVVRHVPVEFTQCSEDAEERIDVAVDLLTKYFDSEPFDCEASKQENEENQSNGVFHGDSKDFTVKRSLTAEAEGSEQRGTPASDIADALQNIADIAADLLSRCLELLDFQSSHQENQRSSALHEVGEDLIVPRGKTAEDTKGSEQTGVKNIPASGIEHVLQQIVDVAADLLSKCFQLLEFQTLYQENEENQSNHVPHGVGEDPPVQKGVRGITAKVTSGIQHTLQQIADVAADLLSKCLELIDLEAANQEKEEKQRSSAAHEDPLAPRSPTGDVRDAILSEQRCVENVPTKSLQQIADTAADLLSRCFELLDFQTSHQEKEKQFERSSSSQEIEVSKGHTQSGLEDNAAEITEGSEHTGIRNVTTADSECCDIAEEGVDIAAGVLPVAVEAKLLACETPNQEREKQRSAPNGVSDDPNVQKGLNRFVDADVNHSLEQRDFGDIPASGIQADRYYEAIHQMTVIASELPSKCSELLHTSNQEGNKTSQESRRVGNDLPVLKGSGEKVLSASGIQHNLQQIVDVAADLISKCFELEILYLEGEEDQRSCADNMKQRWIASSRKALQQIADVAADLLFRCSESSGLQISNQRKEGNHKDSSPQGDSEDPPFKRSLTGETTKVSEQRGAECCDALQHIADIATAILSRCFELFDIQNSHLQEENQQSSALHKTEYTGQKSYP